jgi:hypothetical protein
MNSFWDWFWLMVWWFFFVWYLIILFQIIRDVFRDDSLNGWVKALWVIFLIIVPFLSMLIYLIVRGRGMGERQMAEYAGARAANEQYIRSVAGSGSSNAADQIASAKGLLDSGAITPAEYEQLKQKALA